MRDESLNADAFIDSVLESIKLRLMDSPLVASLDRYYYDLSAMIGPDRAKDYVKLRICEAISAVVAGSCDDNSILVAGSDNTFDKEVS